MNSLLSKNQIEDLLTDVLDSPKVLSWKNDKLQFCCTIHGEKHPSCGLHSYYIPDGSSTPVQLFHCFSCGEKGTLTWLVYRSLPDRFRSLEEVEKFFMKRYGVNVTKSKDLDSMVLPPLYEEQFIEITKTPRFITPMTKLAVFKSGIETYKYFYNRGFDHNDLVEYQIGRDLIEKTVTIPVFWEDKTLSGVIGRFIDPNRLKHTRFRVYDFPKSEILFPLDKLEVINNTIIGVEAIFDVMMMRKWGIKNVVAIMGDQLSPTQANIIRDKCDKFVCLFDYDKGGNIAIKSAKELLKGYVDCLIPTWYPEEGKDPIEWGKDNTLRVIESASVLNKSRLKKYSY